MKTFLKTFLKDESGASAAEYALILAVVGVAIGAAAFTLGDEVRQAIEGAAQNINDCTDAVGGECATNTIDGGTGTGTGA